MSLERLRMLGLAGLLAAGPAGFAACETRPAETPPAATNEDQAVAPTTGVADYSLYDDDVETFIPDYVREDEMFTDDDLDYHVDQGVVRVTGTVDTTAERDALVQRIKAVPGVRDVNVDQVQAGTGGHTSGQK